MFTVWSMPECPWCDKVYDLLESAGIEYEIATMPKNELKAKMRMLNVTTVPQVFDHEGYHLGGYETTKKYVETNYIIDNKEYAAVLERVI